MINSMYSARKETKKHFKFILGRGMHVPPGGARVVKSPGFKGLMQIYKLGHKSTFGLRETVLCEFLLVTTFCY